MRASLVIAGCISLNSFLLPPAALAQTGSIDLRINGLKGPITVPNGMVATLSWTSQNVATPCAFSAKHGDAVAAQGPTNTFASYLPTSPIIPTGTALTFIVTCTDSTSGGPVSDAVTVSSVADPYAFVNPQPVTIRGYTGSTKEPQISRDGQYLFFNNQVVVGVPTKLYYATRVDDKTFDFQGEVGGANTSGGRNDNPTIDSSNRIYFLSDRSYLQDFNTTYTGAFSNGTVTGVVPVAGISPSTPGYYNMDQGISPDGNTLYYSQQHVDSGGFTFIKMFVASRTGPGTFETMPNSEAILRVVNERGWLNFAPDVSADGLELYFTRLDPAIALGQIYVARRNSPAEAFSTLQLVAQATGFVEAPSLTLDGTRLYYHVGTPQPPPATDMSWKIYTMTRASKPLGLAASGSAVAGNMPNTK